MNILKQKISAPIAVILIIISAVLSIVIVKNAPEEVNSYTNSFENLEKGIYVKFPKPNFKISSPLTIAGYVNGDGWNAFEGQTGIVKLEDAAGQVLASTVLNATTDWIKGPLVYFKAILEFSSEKEQKGTLVFQNENPSGLPENDREFKLPVIIKKSEEETKVKVYFNNDKLDPEFFCNKVFPVDRKIVKTQIVAKAALEELLKGPTTEEKENGFFTSINQGVKIQSLVIENGTAKIDFDGQLEYQVGGSCRVSAIRAQITQTLKQFSTIKDILISINGRTEDILQP